MTEGSAKMILNTVPNKEKVQQAVTNQLRILGVKPRLKRSVTKPDKDIREKLTKVFNVPLSHQPTDAVQLSTGALVHVPTFVRQAIQFLDSHINQEGLFRKGGSNSRLKELVARLDNGNHLGEKHQAIDVANCLKKYFRDLPDPLIPYGYHDLFVRCGMLKVGKVDAILQACLLLPARHLSTLAFFMDFLKKVSLHEQSNKMGMDNLAKVVGPNVMPLRETTMAAVQTRLDAHLTIVKILIENCKRIGVVPKHILESISVDSNGSTENELDRSNGSSSFKQKKKKHRSGSLTRMFNGLKKIVGKNGSPETAQPNRRSLDSFSQMSPVKITKKRKNAEVQAHQQIIPKKKRDSVDCNSNPTASRVLFASPISNDPNPTQQRVQPHKEKAKKLGLNLERFVPKSRQKMDIDETDRPSSPVIERRWSMASGSSSKYLKKRNFKKISASSLLDAKFRSQNDGYPTKNSNEDYTKIFTDSEVNLSDENFDQRTGELSNTPRTRPHRRSSQLQRLNEVPENSSRGKESEEYVRIPKSEYEEIKNRVSAIESRIHEEFESIDNNYCTDSASEVQSKYERTLDEASIESTTPADQLAKRLGRELKIRRSLEHKVIRSPSARRIGVIRRRSQEKPVSSRRKVSRAASWHISDKSQPLEAKNSPLISQNETNSYCSDATNARLDALDKQLFTLISHTAEHTRSSFNYTEISRRGADNNSFGSPRNAPLMKHIRRASSFHGNGTLENKTISFNNQMQTIRTSNSQRTSLPGNNQQIDSNMLEIVREQDRFTWKNASIVLESEKYTGSSPLVNRNQSLALAQTGRASIAKLRTQNAGMVLAKAKLFDENESHKGTQEVLAPDRQRKINPQVHLREPKISISPTTNSSGVSRRKKSKSPKNIEGKLKVIQSSNYRQTPTKDQENSRKENNFLPVSSMNEYSLCRNAESASFIKTPHIKKPLAMKTPKSARSLVRRAPVDTRRTPLKAVPPISTGTPKRQSPRNAFKSRQMSRNII